MNAKIYQFTLLALVCLFASCGQDETLQSPSLPEGRFPLQIAAVTLTAGAGGQPWTRVTENADGSASVWEGNEQIGVQIGSGQSGIYTVQADGSVEPTNPVYWTSTEPTYITAWYPLEEDIDLSDQSQKLAYVLQAYVDPATYNQTITLNFTHKLAKVRVVLNGSQASQVNAVEVYGITACTHLRGTLKSDASNTGWIKMKQQTYTNGTKCWEANVVPGEVISRVKVNGTEATLTTSLTPVVAALNTITISVNPSNASLPEDGSVYYDASGNATGITQ